MLATNRPRIVVIGAGFGGLTVARQLAREPVDVLLLDRNNYHGFWPLLYQVATAGLDPEEIAQPVRAITRSATNIDFRLVTVQSIDRERQLVLTDRGQIAYDELVVAPGSATNFYGIDQIERAGFELKDLPDAVAIRNHLLDCFEQAVGEPDAARRRCLLTFVLVGGGPTGVEMAGAIAELIRHVFQRDYPSLDMNEMRVVLVEATDRILLAFPPILSQTAQRTLEKFGVELRLEASVTGYEGGVLNFKDGSALETETVIWAAGVKGAPLGETLGVKLERGGRVPVTPALHLDADPHVWVIGDLAHIPGTDGKPLPQVATVAMQQGRHAAANIVRKQRGRSLKPFRYIDKGSLATVGRRFAVARVWGLNWRGPLAWYLWLAVHIWYLVGFRNRLQVLINWAYYYFTYDRGSRVIITGQPKRSTQWNRGSKHDELLA